ncbi:MAG: hypothetical protein ABJC09_13555 [Terriglobia bacterium]
MMDELINAVSARTGLGQDQARSAVVAVLGLLKSRLPAPLASALDSFVVSTTAAGADSSSGETGGEGGRLVSEAGALLGNLFGKKQ